MRLTRHHGNVVALGLVAAAMALAIPGSASAQRGTGPRGRLRQQPGHGTLGRA